MNGNGQIFAEVTTDGEVEVKEVSTPYDLDWMEEEEQERAALRELGKYLHHGVRGAGV